MTNGNLNSIRATILQMSHDSGESHLNGSLSCVEILAAVFDVIGPQDRFIFSKGHACSALYATLAQRGIIPKSWLSLYGKPDSPLPNHPCVYALPWLRFSSGSLGHGLGVGAGVENEWGDMFAAGWPNPHYMRAGGKVSGR